MSVLDLPNELLFPIAKELAPHDLHSSVLANRRFTVALSEILHDSAANDKKHTVAALVGAAAIGHEAMVRLVLEKGPRLVIEDTSTCRNGHSSDITPAEYSEEQRSYYRRDVEPKKKADFTGYWGLTFDALKAREGI